MSGKMYGWGDNEFGTKEETGGSSGDDTVYVFICVYIYKYNNIQEQSEFIKWCV